MTQSFSPQFAQLLAEQQPGWSLAQPFYNDPQIYRLDVEKLIRPAWLFAGHSCQIPRPGDYFRYDVDGDSLVIVRGDDGQARALYNTCRHRGSLICLEEAGHVGKLVCPYHQWTYARDGRLLGCGGIPEEVDRSALGLAPAELREVAGLLFVSLADEPPDFAPAAEVFAAQAGPQGLDRAKVACQKDYVIEANWKLVWENNRECLHCPVGHPQYVKANYDVAGNDPATLARIESRSRACEVRWQEMGLSVGYRRGGLTVFPDQVWYRANRTALAEGFVTESLDGQPVGPLMGDYSERDVGTLRISTLPNFWNHSSSDHSVSTRLTPAGPERTLAQVTWLVAGDAVEGRDYELERLLPFWQWTSEQDWTLCANNQRGVNSRRYRPGPYSASKEYNVDGFARWYLRQLQG